MNSPMQLALAEQWRELPPALQAHYAAECTDSGELSVDYPRYLQPLFSVLRRFGALIDRRGAAIKTVVVKRMVGAHQTWQRVMSYPDGTVKRFDSRWLHAGGNQIDEYVNAFLGVRMAVSVVGGRLHYAGVCFVVKLGGMHLRIPEWLGPGHSIVVEQAIDEQRFAMDFRMRHPLFGQAFRYAGEFTTTAGCLAGQPAEPCHG